MDYKNKESIKNITFILFSLAWFLNYIAMTLFGSINHYSYALVPEIGSRLMWSIILIFFLCLYVKRFKENSIKILLNSFLQYPYYIFLFILGSWFVFVAIKHGVYVETLSSSFTIFFVLGISILGIKLKLIDLSLIYRSLIIGSSFPVLISLFLFLFHKTSFVGIIQPFNNELSWGLFENPNAFGSVLMVLILACVSFFFSERNLIIKIFLTIYFLICIYLLHFTFHRSVYISLFLSLIIITFLNYGFKIKIYILLFLISIVFFIFYLWKTEIISFDSSSKWNRFIKSSIEIYNQPIEINSFDEILTNYKLNYLFSNRLIQIKHALVEIKKHPIIGNGSKKIFFDYYGYDELSLGELSLVKKPSNNITEYKTLKGVNRSYHSFPLQLVVLYGFPALLLFIILHYPFLLKKQTITSNKLTLFAVLSILIYNIFNESLLNGIQFMSVFYLFLILLIFEQHRDHF